MTVFALTGSNSLSSTGSWEQSKVIECDLNLFNLLPLPTLPLIV